MTSAEWNNHIIGFAAIKAHFDAMEPANLNDMEPEKAREMADIMLSEAVVFNDIFQLPESLEMDCNHEQRDIALKHCYRVLEACYRARRRCARAGIA